MRGHRKLMLLFEERAHAKKNQIGGTGQFQERKSPRRSRQHGRQAKGGGAGVENTSNRNAERGGDAGSTSMRNAPSENVKRVRSRREIKENAGGDEEREIMNSKHGRKS